MRFDECFALVVGAEGGYVNDPADPGDEGSRSVISYPAKLPDNF